MQRRTLGYSLPRFHGLTRRRASDPALTDAASHAVLPALRAKRKGAENLFLLLVPT